MQERIGRYQILEEIASGGQGSVHRAFDSQTGQIVAVKVLHSHLSRDTDFLERFHREARLAASIDHPNVIRIFEVGQEGDTHFISMEFLPDSLANVIDKAGALPVERAVAFIVQIAAGLAAAHALGIVHRDVKPQNVLIGPDGTAKVTDFGIARAQVLPTMTATGAMMGTPHYMSPEQARGERADARSDVYSLGCILYHMLTGDLPFKGNTPYEVLRQHIEEKARPIRELRREVPRGVVGAVERAMAKDVSRRFQTPPELTTALYGAMPQLAPQPVEPQRAPRPRPPGPIESGRAASGDRPPPPAAVAQPPRGGLKWWHLLLPAVLVAAGLVVALNLPMIMGDRTDQAPVVVERVMVKEVPVERLVVVEKEVVKEVPVEKIVVVEKEVVKEVPVEVVVEKEVVVVKEVPVEVIKEVEVVREVVVEKVVIATPTSVTAPTASGWLLKAPEPNPKYGGIVKTAWPNKLDHYDLHQGNIAYGGLTSLYSQLTYFNQADGYRTIAPDLAASWEVSSDGRRYIFNLRNNVLWSDSTPFTCGDVDATFERILSPPAGKGLTIINTVNFEMVDKVECPDDLKVMFTLKRPTPWFMEVMSFDPHFGPPNIYQRKALIQNDWNLRDVLTPGTGTWLINEERPGEYYLLERNPLHFNPNIPYPDFTRMFHVPVWADRGAAVLTGQADWTWNVSYDTWIEGGKHPEIGTGTRPSFGGGLGVHLNQNKDKALPYSDPRVVKAMFLAFNQARYMAVVEAAFKPVRLHGWLPLSNPAALTPQALARLPGYRADKSEDLPQARRLMAEAGYPDGFKGTITCINPAVQSQVLCPEIQAQFKKSLNIDLELIIVDRSGVGDIYTSGDWEFFYGAPPIGVRLSDPTPNWLTEAVCGAEKNYRGYCNPEFDRIVYTLLDEFDPIERTNLFARARDLLNEQPPGLLGGANQALPMWWKYVKGHALGPPGHAFIQWGRFDTVWLDK